MERITSLWTRASPGPRRSGQGVVVDRAIVVDHPAVTLIADVTDGV